MAGNGPAPKENRRRRNADTYADVQVKVQATATKLHGRPLELATAGMSLTWPPQIKALVEEWWMTWRRSPLAEAFLETDWQRLAMMAPLVASYYARPGQLILAEIRQNESLLGATHVDRLKARIKVERDEPDTATAPGVTALADYRARLGAA